MAGAPQPRRVRLEGCRDRLRIGLDLGLHRTSPLSSTTQIAVRSIDASSPEKNSIARLLC
jgi:hypothetical protein